ncbi:glycosyltransferase [Indioceanicola profundi]|uniref:glycosyltransferase n=1 Tax=Indioceanicola profundi TaxID=2220096 RepID=UPI000E6AB8AD|nr:glycosyltransferase [Indioceanicola profundi]
MTNRDPLRIAFRVGRFPTLSETFVLSQIEGMIERGHRVSILADSPADGDGPAALPGRLAGLEEVNYVLPRSPLLAQTYMHLPYRIRRALAGVEERRMCRDNDIVVCNFGWFGAMTAESVGGRQRRARILTIFHGDDMSRTVTQAEPDLYAELFRVGDVLAAVSDFWRRRLVELGAPEEKLTVHHMGVDVDRYPFNLRPPAEARPFELVTVGRLVEKKGAEFILRALARVRESRPDLRFRLRAIGDGPLREPLEALRAELGLQDRVEFLGAVAHERVAEVLAASDAFVLPSVVASDGDMEGIPVSLMEAMASGLPVVSTRHSGIPELVEHGVSGLLAEERDVEDLARQLTRIMTDADGRAELARAARRTVELHFNERLLNDRLDAMLRRLAGREHEPFPLHEPLLRRA